VSVFVTGASGFLGGRLTQVLVRQGEQVTVLARPASDLRHLSAFVSGPIRVVTGALTESASLLEAVRDATVVFHCAAASTDWARMPIYTESNVRGTQTLLDAARRATRLRRFVHVSTTDVYGYPSIPCAETGALKDAGLPYNRTKILAEKAVWREAQQNGLPVTVIRPATIYGPRGKAFVSDIAALLRKRQMISINGGRATAGLLYIDDAVDAMIAAARSPAAEGRAYNLSDGSGTTWKEYVSALARGLGSKLPWIDLPFGMAIGIARAMEAPFRYLAMPGRPPLTRHAVFLLGRHQEFPAHKARAELDFCPKVSVDEGIARSVDWLKSASSRPIGLNRL
jgi:nucleoside-diphosphate-sugar epimerase